MQTLSAALLDAVLAIAHQAGQHLSTFYHRSVKVQIKSDLTPVTEADLFVSQFVTEQLKQLTPHIPVLSEESCKVPFAQRRDWQEYWLIDPLDGTQQFIDRTDQFSVMISLVQQGVPVLGVIHAPILAKTYYARKGQGAFLLEQGKLRQLGKIGEKSANSDRLLIGIGTSNQHAISQSVQAPYPHAFFQYGSSSLKAGLVAEHHCDCYVRFGNTGEWDTAVAEVILGEVGGKIFDLSFKPLTYNQRETLVNPYFVMVGDASRPWQQIFDFSAQQ